LLNKIQLGSERIVPGIAFIFDMDGVIVDSNPLHREAWATFNRRFGVETTEDMQQRMYGKRNDQIVRDFFGEGLSAEEVLSRGAAKEVLYRQLVSDKLETMLVPGIRDFLERYRGVPTALATNAEPENVNLVLNGTGLRQYFKTVITGHEVRRPKPDPEVYLRAAEMLETAPRNCIVFEDSHSGVQAACAGGMITVLVRTTHEYLPGISFSIDNFMSGELSVWLAAQNRAA
jgi:beta-phosphoglucomutase